LGTSYFSGLKKSPKTPPGNDPGFNLQTGVSKQNKVYHERERFDAASNAGFAALYHIGVTQS